MNAKPIEEMNIEELNSSIAELEKQKKAIAKDEEKAAMKQIKAIAKAAGINVELVKPVKRKRSPNAQ